MQYEDMRSSVRILFTEAESNRRQTSDAIASFLAEREAKTKVESQYS